MRADFGVNRLISLISRNDLLKIRFTKAVLWTLIGATVSRAFSLISSIWTGRLLGLELFGQLSIVQNMFILLGAALGTGISVAVSKLVSEYRDTEKKIFIGVVSSNIQIAICLGLIVTIFFFIASPWISRRILNLPQVVGILQIGTVYLFLSIVNGSMFGIISGIERYKAYSFLYMVHGLFLFVFMILGAKFFELSGAVFGLCGSEFFSLIVNFLVMKAIVQKNYGVLRCFKFKYGNPYKIFNTIFASITSRIVIIPAIWITNIILVNQFGGVAALGRFNASDLRQVILFAPTTISTTILPILSNMISKGEKDDFRKIVRLSTFVNIVISFIPATMLFIFSKRIMMLYGEEFVDGALTLQLLVCSTLPTVVNIIYGQVLISTGFVWKRTLFDFLLGVMIISCSLYFIPRFLDVGLSISYLVAYSMISLMMVLEICRSKIY